MSAGQPESAPVYHDTRDLTPFRDTHIRTPVHTLAEGVGELLSTVLGNRDRGLLDVDGEVPRLKRLTAKPAKAVYDAIFTNAQPDRLITLAREYPGWAGLCYIMAGLLAYRNGGHLRASELLQRGLSIRNDDDANSFAGAYLTRVLTVVEVAERVEVPVLFSEESVFLALSHSLREIGQTAAALEALGSLPPSLPTALARCSLLASLGRDAEVAAYTQGLLNADDLSAALLLVRARALRKLGEYGAARVALQEVLRRRKTSAALRNDALTDRALLVLIDNGKRTLNPRDWQRRKPAELESVDAVVAIRKDDEVRKLWEQDWKQLGGD